MSPDFMHLDRILHSESGRFPELAEIAEVRARRGVEYLAANIQAFAVRENIPCSDPEAAADHFMTTMTGRTAIVVVGNRKVRPEESAAWLAQIVQRFLGGRPSW